MDETLKDKCNRLRKTLKEIEVEVRGIREHSSVAGGPPAQSGEVIAQSMLAVRHLEDARMRLGKVIQYSGDGVSKYDKAEPFTQQP